VLALFAVGFYRGIWRYFGLMDTVVVAKGVVLGTLSGVSLIFYVAGFQSHSRTVFVIDAILLATLLTASRVSFRLFGEFLQRNRKTATRVVIYGAGGKGALVVRELSASGDEPYRILGFADDDPRKLRTRVQGYPVLGGWEAFSALVTSGAIDAVIVSPRMIELNRLQAIESLCGTHGIAVSRWRGDFEPLVAGSRTP
jgi:FlaA1/EpsC-like NDP-sugar epimerase